MVVWEVAARENAGDPVLMLELELETVVFGVYGFLVRGCPVE